MPSWTFVLANSSGTNLAELSTATGRTLTFQRNSFPEAALTISHDDDAASELFTALTNTGIPHLKAYRDGILRFHGYLAPFDEQLEEEAQINLVFRGPFSRLLGDGQYPGRFTAATVTYTATDAGQIAKSLIDSTASVGIDTTGTIQASKARDRTYAYANIGEEIQRLTNVDGGFDFEVIPIDNGVNIGQLIVYASQGSTQLNARFQYGPDTLRNVKGVQRQTLPPRNRSRIIGANGLVGTASSSPSIDLYGEWWVQEQQTDISVQATLDDRAAAVLRPSPVHVVSFTPDPSLAPSPWTDYWLGDVVSFYGRRGAFSETAQLRVNRIVVTVDDEGNETAEIPDPGLPGATVEATVAGEIVG